MQFEALPTEVIVHVFSYLRMVDFLKCGEVSKRLRAISSDDQYLWPKKLNLCYKKVPAVFLQKLLESGCKYLSLSESLLDGTLNLTKASGLINLNLSGFANRKSAEEILEFSYSLQKLSLSYFHLSLKLISITSLQNGKTLKVLDLSKCTFCTSEKNCAYIRRVPFSSLMRSKDYSFCTDRKNFVCNPSYCAFTVPIKQIVENCTQLKELSLSMTKLCTSSIDTLVSNLTVKIEKLDLYAMYALRDKHVKTLVTRCNRITELNLGGWTSITEKSLNFIIERLQLTLVKLDLEATHLNFDSSAIFKLKSMGKLKFLCYDNIHIDGRWLQKQLPNLQINSEPGNTRIAIPCKLDYLRISDLLKSGQISKRFRATISNDCQYLWPKKLNFCYKKLPARFLQDLLDSGCACLILSEDLLGFWEIKAEREDLFSAYIINPECFKNLMFRQLF